MKAKSPQFRNNQFYSPDDTQRDMTLNKKPAFSPDNKSQKIPGTKSLHLYNTLLFVFNAAQIGLYASQAVNVACPQRNLWFYLKSATFSTASWALTFTRAWCQ